MRIESFLRQSPVFQVNRMARRMDASLNLMLKDEELSVFEALVLAAIFFEKRGTTKPSEPAEAFQPTRGNVSHCISSLEAKGLVERKIDPEDARAYHLALKPFGKKAAMRVIGALDKVQREFEKKIGKDALHSALQVIRSLGDSCPSRSVGS